MTRAASARPVRLAVQLAQQTGRWTRARAMASGCEGPAPAVGTTSCISHARVSLVVPAGVADSTAVHLARHTRPWVHM